MKDEGDRAARTGPFYLPSHTSQATPRSRQASKESRSLHRISGEGARFLIRNAFMKCLSTRVWLLPLFLVLLCGFLLQASAQPLPYVSNFGNQWPGGGIGDIHGFTAEPIIARFRTGNTPTELNAVSLEFLAFQNASGWEAVDVQVRAVTAGAQWIRLANPSINPLPTQWPTQPGAEFYTVYVDFRPADITYMPAQTSFEVAITAPTTTPTPLLYSAADSYSSIDGWRMGPTTINNPFASGQFLKMAVYGAAVPEPQIAALLLVPVLLLAARKRQARA